LAGLAPARDLDELDGRLVQGVGELLEPAPVGVGLLGDDLALLDDALQDAHDVEAIAPPLKPQGQVHEVDEDGQRAFAVSHSMPWRFFRASFWSADSDPWNLSRAFFWMALIFCLAAIMLLKSFLSTSLLISLISLSRSLTASARDSFCLSVSLIPLATPSLVK